MPSSQPGCDTSERYSARAQTIWMRSAMITRCPVAGRGVTACGQNDGAVSTGSGRRGFGPFEPGRLPRYRILFRNLPVVAST
jgi:hypothetical protein